MFKQGWESHFIADSITGDARWRARNLVRTSLFCSGATLLFVPVLAFEGLWANAVAAIFGAVAFRLPMFFLQRGQHNISADIFTAVATANVFVGTLITGEMSSITSMSLLMVSGIGNVSRGSDMGGGKWLWTHTAMLALLLGTGAITPSGEWAWPSEVVSYWLIGSVLHFFLRTYGRLAEERTGALEAANEGLVRAKQHTERLRRAVEAEKKSLSHILENLPVAVCWTDGAGGVLHHNEMYTRLGGDSTAKQVSRVSRVGTDDAGDTEEVWATPAGDKVNVLVKRLIMNHGILGRGVLVVAMDVTQEKALEDQLQRARHMEAIGQLAAGVAHEINTPIQYVSDNTRFLQESFEELLPLIHATVPALEAPSEEKTAQLLAQIRNADTEFLSEEIPPAISQSLDGLKRVSEIVAGLKTFSHPSAEIAEADLNAGIEATITVSRNEWKYRADIETHLDPNLGLVQCRLGEINQVVLNLIVNASHAVEDRYGSAVKGLITVASVDDGDQIEIRVTDNGCGMPEQVRERIFEPFFTTKAVGRGTGQGLSMAYNVVESHGGTISVTSEVGVGTTFVITLPRVASRAAA